MQNIAIYTPTLTVYWSSVVIALGALSFFALAYALFTANKGNPLAMVLFIPVCMVLSVVLSRAIHWYCHQEQYASLAAAIKSYAAGSFCVPGILIAIVLSVLLARLLRLTGNAGRMLDCTAPAAALGLAVIRMSSLFNNACRGKIIISTPSLQFYPLAAPVTSGGTVTEYRFATFFIEAIVLLVLTIVILKFFFRHRRARLAAGCKQDGNVFRMFLLGYCAVEIVLDSTRYDSSFFPFNGFVSLVQILAIAAIVYVLVFYSIYSVRVNGLRWYHWLLWLLFLLMAGLTGISEYLVQRHGNWYLSCYTAMSAACVLLAVIPYRLYRTLRE